MFNDIAELSTVVIRKRIEQLERATQTAGDTHAVRQLSNQMSVLWAEINRRAANGQI